MKFESLVKENPNALDNFRNLARLVAPRARHFLHNAERVNDFETHDGGI